MDSEIFGKGNCNARLRASKKQPQRGGCTLGPPEGVPWANRHDSIISGLGLTVPVFEHGCSISWKIVRCLPSGHRSASHQKSRRKKTARRRSVFAAGGFALSWQGNSVSSARARERAALTVSIFNQALSCRGLVISTSASALAANGPT